jgi:hypothetical protein
MLDMRPVIEHFIHFTSLTPEANESEDWGSCEYNSAGVTQQMKAIQVLPESDDSKILVNFELKKGMCIWSFGWPRPTMT